MKSEQEIRERLAELEERMNDSSITHPEYKELRQEQIKLMQRLNDE